MINAFNLLSLPPRLFLDESVLQQAYLAKSRLAHPDHGGSDALASEVNAAYETLRTPEKRLRHLLELAAPEEARAWRAVPLDESMMRLFSAVGQALEKAAKFLAKKDRAQTALARALLAGEEMQQREQLEELGSAITTRMEEMEAALPELDAQLGETSSLETWKTVASMQARLAYLTKWQTQLRERLLQLM